MKKIGVAIGSGGIYSAAGLGVIECLEEKGINISIVGGASGGAIMAALYFLEGNARVAQTILIDKLSTIKKIKLSRFGKPTSGELVKKTIDELLDKRDWQDGKISGVCFGTGFLDTREPVVLTKGLGLSLTESVLASISLKMIEPVVRLNGKLIGHGGDPDYLKRMKEFGADFILEVFPVPKKGILGRAARVGNKLSSIAILRGKYLAVRKARKKRKVEEADMTICPNVSIFPLIFPLDFSVANAKYMIEKGRMIMDKSFPTLKKRLERLANSNPLGTKE